MIDYRLKYIKYKKKYLELLNQKGGGEINNEYIEKLKRIYNKPEFLNDGLDYGNNHITYGEITYEGIEEVIKKMKEIVDVNKYKNFVDIGSGNGKYPLYMAGLNNIKKSIGIEIVKIRHKKAEELKETLKEEKEIEKVKFINDDFRKVNLKTETNGEISIVFISNLCFNEEMNEELYKKLIDELPTESIIISSKKANIIKDKKTIEIICQMSWNLDSTVYLTLL
jgi:hypothetical protein